MHFKYKFIIKSTNDNIEDFEYNCILCSYSNDRNLLIVKYLSCFVNVILNNYQILYCMISVKKIRKRISKY